MLNNLLTVLKNGKDKILYQIDNEKITYLESYYKVKKLSESLKKQGNSPIILYGHKSINQFISILACITSKRCYIPIDTYIPKARIKEIIKETKTTLIIKNEKINIGNIETLTIEELNTKYNQQKEEYPQKNQDAYIIFTSGSTGKSKGVPISYKNLNHFITLE